MAVGDKAYVLNRENDWLNHGVVDTFTFEDDVMVLKNNTGKNGQFISTSLDSGEKETVWDRLRLKMNKPENAIVRVSVYASDELTAEININAKDKEEIVIDRYIQNKNIPINDRMRLLNKFASTVYFDNVDDVPLYCLKGRYLWVAIEVLNYSLEAFSIESLKIDFPLYSFLELLPEIYRRNSPPESFLSRFMGIFQSVYTDIENDLNDISGLFDPQKTTKEMLVWMTEWFSIRDSYIWSEDKLRVILKNMIKLYKIKGTKQAICEVVRLYTGSMPVIIEQFEVTDNEFYERNKDFVKSLYGENGYTFTVVLNNEEINDSDEYIALLKIINLFKPAEAKCNLVVLNNDIYLDYHCYLGVNSYISCNKEMVLGKEAMVVDSVYLTNIDE